MAEVIETHRLISIEEAAKTYGPDLQQIYNGLDCCVTLEVWNSLQAYYNESPITYNFERALQAPALEMMLRGFRIDLVERERSVRELREKQTQYQAILDKLAIAVWDKPLNPRSPKQLLEFFYKHLNIPEIWSSKKGVKSLSMDRETLEKLDLYLYARPFVACILSIRELAKKLDVLEAKIDPDGRMRTSINVGATETGRFSASKSTTGTGCVLPTTQALTPNGWKTMDTILDGDLIAQWNNGKIEFVPCKMHSEPFSGKLLKITTEQLIQTLTPDHRCLFLDSRMQNILVEPAKTVAARSQVSIPLGGKHQGTKTVPPFAAILMADFEKTEWGWRGAFKKERKQKRFLELAKKYSIPFRESKNPREGYRRFTVLGYTEIPKKWGKWILDLTVESAQALLEEARHWDATDFANSKHSNGPSFTFFTADPQQAVWFATLAHLSGKSANTRLTLQNEGSYSDTPMWNVHVKERQHARVQRAHWSQVPYEGLVYCPQVPSSFWLMREEGKISVTGNTNLFNVTSDCRQIFVADPGYKLCAIDLEQAESREVGRLCGELFNEWAYLDACEAGDLHTAVARLIWPELAWTGDGKKDRQIAEEPFYRHYSYRDIAKRGGHGTNYLGSPFQMARHLKVPTSLVNSFQERYFDAFPGIQKWHRWTAEQIQSAKPITTVFGRTRHFFGRPNDDQTVKEAVAYNPQSSTADRLNIGLYRIWHDMSPRIEILLQLYDAIYFQYREDDDEEEIVAEALRLVDVPIKLANGRIFTVPGEAKVGWNWTPIGPNNPDGLAKFKGKDTRQRVALLDRIF